MKVILTHEVSGLGIKVHLVEPGYTRTDMSPDADRRLSSPRGRVIPGPRADVSSGA